MTPPTITVTGPLANASVPAGIHNLVADLNDASGISASDFYVDGSLALQGPRCRPSCAVHYDDPAFNATETGYGPGPHTLRLTATDRYGNRSEKVWQLQVVWADDSWDLVSPESDLGAAPPEGYGAPDEADYCLADPESQTADYCGANDVGPDTEAYYNEPPLGGPSGVTRLSGTLSNPPAFGLSDQHVETINATPTYRQLFNDLAIHKARRTVPWDVVVRATAANRCGPQDTESLQEVDDWVAGARALSQEILISFEHSRNDQSGACLPTVDEYKLATRAFRTRYPDIKLFTAWNEPNHGTQPTSANPIAAGVKTPVWLRPEIF